MAQEQGAEKQASVGRAHLPTKSSRSASMVPETGLTDLAKSRPCTHEAWESPVDTACLARRGLRGGIASRGAIRYGIAGSSKDELSVSSHDVLAHRTCTATDGIYVSNLIYVRMV